MSELECSLFKMGRMGVLEEMNVYWKKVCVVCVCEKSMFCVLKVCFVC